MHPSFAFTPLSLFSLLMLCFGCKNVAEDDMSEDRMIALRKRADIDSKHLIVFATNNNLELKQSLDR